MEERNFELDIRQWLDLSKGGKAKEAKDFYYENLFDTVIERFEKNNQQVISGSSVDVLISILGFSPEPIVLGAKLLKPKTHIIIHDAGVSLNEENNRIISKYLENYKFVELHDETFACLYDTLKEQLSITPCATLRYQYNRWQKIHVCLSRHICSRLLLRFDLCGLQ